ncbi:phosphoadenosine phosphosulfate reductase family protein [Clostridium bowmanii]|uniref:phosphoadenosine phosphosulfate reductase domain-containing protein n=1 Tax=Clostridium bowmanii TaxID=132925 RepID=UPI001C0BF04E|nr:phosphoadenosine phosphosulfate reductase family protein [Clostridium bowmanii]MBU3188737.1 phosphoadenosine phosphosulfate reductase family protein [Clostridium bowmanii]MCA1073322.1 phosphoadenosine phosphosulfate reductase family protein [Clostridium bowmanii]
MYNYDWDSTTGGYILNTTASKFSKEPRPVYYKELDILGFDAFWDYEKDDSLPYMWAESSYYYYRGKMVAKTIGGGLYTAPKLEVYEENLKLRFVDVDAMVEKNIVIMDALVNDTIKKVYNAYISYKSKIDVFYVAFSGGKDSIVLLDVVQKALPHNEFVVVFGDTDMECEDTYKVRDEIERFTNYEDIKFYTAKSHLKSTESWNIFGPPAHRLRWCCTVHKTTPQINLLRKILRKPNFRGMAFTGIRKDESPVRSEYDTINVGKKHEGQYSMNAIDAWSTAELYLYIYKENLMINEAYKKGNSRVGCIVCPMSSGKHEFIKGVNYPGQVSSFMEIIKNKSNRKFDNQQKENDFFYSGGWKMRNNGRDIEHNMDVYEEIISDNTIRINIQENTEWKIWMKTIGVLIQIDKDRYSILANGKEYIFSVTTSLNKLNIELNCKSKTKEEILFVSAFKIVFKKTVYCVKCGVCEANCIMGYINMENGLYIDDKCLKCRKCHNIDSGCLVYNSLKDLKGVGRKMSLDCYASFGVEKEWVIKYLKYQEDFWKSKDNDLGSVKITALKRFLKDAMIKPERGNNKNGAEKSDIMNKTICKLGLNSTSSWALILCNLVYTPQFNWFTKELSLNERYLSEQIKAMISDNYSKGSKNNIASSLKNILTKTPLGRDITKKPLEGDIEVAAICETRKIGGKDSLVSITRTSWKNPDSKVVLYGLYKFAEICGDYYQFSLSRLMNYDIDSEGISPTLIFGIDEETITKILSGLAVNHPEFITVGFTHDLDNINLNSEKTSSDVLRLFIEGC